MRRMLAVLLLLVAASTLRAAEWPTDLDAALARAQSEKKVVLAYVRAACGPCNKGGDDFVEAAESYEAIRKSFGELVLVRVESNDRRHPAVARLLRHPMGLPGFVAADQTGESFASFNRLDSHSAFASFLASVRRETTNVVQAGQIRAAGQVAEADLALGLITLRFGTVTRARKLFELSEAAYKKEGNLARAQFATIYSGFTWFVSGLKSKANVILMNITRKPLTQENAAEAWLAIGTIRRMEKDRAGAVKAYRIAYELAPAGSRIADTARQGLALIDDKPLEEKQSAHAATATVRVIKPPRSAITGRAEFRAESDAPLGHVEFFLDEAPVATATQPPFSVRIDVGNVARLHTIKAVAYDTDGAVVGEGVATINDRADALRVAIVSPSGEQVSGPVTVEASATVPPDRKLQRLELFFNERPIGTFTQPPFRAAFDVPAEFGYFRAVATLDDGTSAEDARVVNSGGASATLEVRGVSFAATVVDKDGKRINGLQTSDFTIREEGAPVTATVRGGDDEPVTIGIAIDTSASMKHALLDVVEVSSKFLDLAVNENDRVFFVNFDVAPKLLHPPSNDVKSLRSKILDLSTGSGTAMFDGIVFALQQFQGVPGKKALIVISDGGERASTANAAAAVRLAKDSGIPIYAVIPPDGFAVARRMGNPLHDIATSSGGLVFHSPRGHQLPAIFDLILQEARGQYLMTFVSTKPGKSGEWRKLTVDVPGRPDAKVRTVAGYYAR